MEHQRHVVKAKKGTHAIQPLVQLANIAVPKLAHEEQSLVRRGPQHIRPLVEKVARVVHDGVQPKSLRPQFIYKPLAPFIGLLHDLGIGIVDIFQHEIVCIALQVPHVLRPVLAALDEAVDLTVLRFFVPVGPIEVALVVSKSAVFSIPTSIVEFCPSLNFVRLGNVYSSICNKVSTPTPYPFDSRMLTDPGVPPRPLPPSQCYPRTPGGSK